MYLVSDLIVVKFTESFLSASSSSPVAVQFPVAHLQSKLRCLRTSYLICTILLTFQLWKSANFRYTDPGSTIGQTQDGDFETYLNLQKGGWNQTFYPPVKQNALDTKSLTNPNMKAGTVTLLMQGPTPPLRPKLASPQPTQECKQVSQQQPAQPRKYFFPTCNCNKLCASCSA